MAIRLYKLCLVSALTMMLSLTGLNAQSVAFSKTNVTCNGGTDGTITMTLSSGGSSYRYVCYNSFEPSESDSFGPTALLTHTFTSLPPGVYFSFVRDLVSGDVLDYLSMNITQPAVITATVASTNPTCFGINNGTITISNPSGGTGGTGPYDYTIDGGANWLSSGSFTGLAAGTYIVRIRTRNYPTCVVTLNANLIISQPAQLNATLTFANVTCFGKNNGTININGASGGSGTYQYTITGGTSWSSTTSYTVAPGTYNVQMRDANATSCSLVLNSALVITQPAVLTVTDISIIKGLTCNEGSDGQLRALVTGGTGPYTYDWYRDPLLNNNWVTINQYSQTATNLPQGWYEVRVNDANNCGVPAPATSREFFLQGATDSIPPVFVFDSASVLSACAGQSNGSISIYAHGGKTPYRYSITTGGAAGYQPVNTFSNLSAGNYQTWAMDKKGCKKQGPDKTVATIPNLPVSATIAANPSGAICPGTSVQFTATPVNGGTTPAYQWQLNGTNTGSGGNTYTNASLANGDQIRVILTSNLRCTSGNPATSNTITTSLLALPSISVQPVSLTRCTSQAATFSVTAAGAGLTYQWRKGGVNIPSATGASYTIAAVATTDAGSYDVVITGTCGNITSNAATLTVNIAPAITDQPDNASACVGQGASFTVAASGTITSYQWRKGGVNIPGAIAATYSIASVALTDAGNYDVVITGPCGTVTSNLAALAVTTVPVITDQPDNVTVCAGLNAGFTVTVSGTVSGFQWRKNGTNIPGAIAASYNITGVAITDAGNYTVVITGPCGSVTSSIAILSVNTAPVITAQPVNTAACVGFGASFSVTANGTGLTYQWRKGGVNIPSATGASYAIAAVVAGDAGSYDVVITGTCGNLTSNAATLTVNTAPSISVQPVSLTRCTGQAATFSVTAAGTGLTYQWRKGGANIPSATGASYTIAAVAAGDAASYDVVITGTCGNVTSNAATLIVNTAPVITAQPLNTAVCVGSGALFSVTATGAGLTYQWRKGGVNIPSATGASYIIAAVAAGDAGSYDVVITGTCGNLTSNAATLTVNIAPSISVQPVSLTRCTGQAATFSVTAAGTGLTYQWRKGGANIPSATGASYTIAAVAAGDAANYDVVITGTCGNITSNAATLTVNTAPAITAQPVNTSACVGSGASFSVTANGTGLTYQWRKGGVNIPSATGANYIIAAVVAGDAGSYDVVITGTCGNLTSNAATLTVNTAPSISVQPVSLTRCTGQAATFSVTAAGTGLTYQWRKGGANIPSATGASYTIAAVAAGDAASYDVVITGTCGNVTSNAATLTINPAPAITTQPVNVTVCAGLSASFNVVASGTITSYQWRKGGVNIPGAINPGYSIAAVVPTDAGNYDVVITGPCGTVTSNVAILTVNLPPSITAQPVAVTSCEGTTVTFTVTAIGTGLNYQWRKNGTNIGGANTSLLTLNNITLSSAADYDVVITGTCGNLTSNDAALIVAEEPSIISHPANQEVCEGSPVTLNVIATGTEITYQWRRNGTNLAGETSPTLSIASATPAQSGNYDALVIGRCGTLTSNIAIVTIDPATAVISSGNDTLVCEGGNVDFNILANGHGAISYQWQREIEGAWINLADGGDIAGVITDHLSIQNVDASDTGYYRCFISSACGTAYSVPVRLDMNLIIASIGTPAPFLIDSITTLINVHVEVTDRFLNWDLGFALVAPDGTQVMLKAPAPFPCVFNPVGNAVNANFTNDPAVDPTDTINYCWNTKLISGTFAATGDWNVLHDMDPANGAWQVWVYDSDKSVPDPDGYLRGVTLTFTDLDINGDTAIINYNSGTIQEEILNPIGGELRATSFVVPIRLMTSCFNSVDARAVVTVQGGIEPYTYEWTGPTTVPDQADVMLGPGNYSVLVTDALGCTSIATVEVTSPPDIVFDSEIHTDTIACFGSNEGIIRSKASGGTGNITYTLLPGNIASSVADSGVFVNLPAGIYTIRATDMNGCALDSTVQIFQHTELTVTIAITPVIGVDNGTITLTASGGVPPYRYSIDNGLTLYDTNAFDNLAAGIYSVYVVDTNGCTFTAQVNLSVELLNVDVTIHNLSCGGIADGSFLLALIDGVGPYTLTGSFLTGPEVVQDGFFSFTGRTAGLYDVRIEDSEGRLFIDTIEISEPPEILLNSDVQNTTCSSDADGAIDITVTGGTGAFTYAWSNGSEDEDITGLVAGVYTVTVTDEATCFASFDIAVLADVYVNADAGFNDIVCPGVPFALLGSPGDSVSWWPDVLVEDPNSPITTATIDTSTTFTYTVYDKVSGCAASDTVRIYTLEFPDMEIFDSFTGDLVNVIYLAEGDSAVLFTSIGYFLHEWSPDQWISSTTDAQVTIRPVEDITYTVVGTTFIGCTDTASVEVIIRRPLKIYTGFSPNGDEYNPTWKIDHAVEYGDLIRIRVYNRWGELVFESKGYGESQEWDGTRNGRPLPVGAYYYIIDLKDGRSKPYTGTVTILR